jgi:hypothetical protein
MVELLIFLLKNFSYNKKQGKKNLIFFTYIKLSINGQINWFFK